MMRNSAWLESYFNMDLEILLRMGIKYVSQGSRKH